MTPAKPIVGRDIDLTIFESFLRISWQLGKNKDFIDREVPHLDRLLAANPAEALADAQVIVVRHADADTRRQIASAARGRRIVDLSGYAELRDCGAAYEGICW